MASGYNLGRAFITITPVMQGAVKDISRSLDGAGLSAGKSFSAALSRGIRGSKVDTSAVQGQLDKAKTAAERAGQAMQDADRKVAKSAGDMARARKDAADRIAIAEAKVNEVRERSISKDKAVTAAEKQLDAARKAGDPGQIAAAEQRLGAARDNAAVTSADLSAEKQLADAREKYGRVSREGITTLNKWKVEQASARAEVDRTTAELKQAESATEQTGNAFTRLGSKLKNAIPSSFRGAFKDLEGDSTKSAHNVENDFERAGRESSSSFRESFKGAFAGVAASVSVYLGFDQVVDGFKESIKGAADLEQSIGGVETVFKGSAKQMLGWSDAADQTLGLTANEYNEFAARLGASLKNAGTPMDELAGKTNGLITMGADLASLYGGTTAEAVDALSAALRGEMDPIERYGISLNDAALTQEGLAMGIKKTGGSFTNQQKQLIVMSLLQKQSADATGNFARENDTASNVAQRLTAKLKDMAAGLGQKLLPVLTGLGNWFINKGLPGLESFGDSMGNVFELLKTGDFKGGIFGLEEDSPVIGALLDVRDAAMSVWKDALKPLVDWLASNKGAIGDFAMGIVAGIGTAISAVASVVQWVVANQDWIVPIAAGIGAIVLAWKAWTTALLVWRGVVALGIAIQTAFNAVMAMNPIGLIVLAIIGLVAALVVAYQKSEWFRGVVDACWAGIKTAIGAVADWIVTYVWPVIKAAWDGIAAAAVWLWQSVLVPAWQGIWAAIQAVAEWITGTLVPWLQGAWTAISVAALWLWQSVIQPVWTGIKVAIAVAVAIVMTLVQAWVWFFQNVVAPVFTWLWNSVIVPVWNGIKAAISAVVSWFQNTAWPIISTVIGWIRQGFELFKLGLSIIWSFIKNNVINPVVSWFQNTVWPIFSTVIGWIRQKFEDFKVGLGIIWSFIKDRVINPVVSWFQNTAWPLISGVIERIKSGFNVMRDALSSAWSYVKNSVIAPVANWFRDTIKPLFDTATTGIKNAFNTMKDAVGEAWDAVKEKAKAPIKFVVETVVRDGIVKNFNKVADKFGVKTIDTKQFTVGFRSGGILPGFSRMRDGDDQLVPMRRGEGVLVSEGLRDRASRSLFLAANAAAKRGTSFASFLGGGYAKGGIIDKIKDTGGDAIDWIKDKAGFVVDVLSDPKGALKKLVDSFTSRIPGAGLILDMAKAVPAKIASAIGDKLTNVFTGSSGDAGAVPAGGGTGGSLGAAEAVANSMGLHVTSRGRRGARTAQNGLVSLHALGRAIDVAGPNMMGYFNAIDARFNPTELLYSPAGARNKHRSGRRGPNTGATLRNHYSHVHVGFAGGGVVPKLYDSGGLVEPGHTSLLNKTGKPEALLTAPQWRDVHEAVSYVTDDHHRGGVQIGAVYGHDAREVGLEIERERRKREALYGGMR